MRTHERILPLNRLILVRESEELVDLGAVKFDTGTEKGFSIFEFQIPVALPLGTTNQIENVVEIIDTQQFGNLEKLG